MGSPHVVHSVVNARQSTILHLVSRVDPLYHVVRACSLFTHPLVPTPYPHPHPVARYQSEIDMNTSSPVVYYHHAIALDPTNGGHAQQKYSRLNPTITTTGGSTLITSPPPLHNCHTHTHCYITACMPYYRCIAHACFNLFFLCRDCLQSAGCTGRGQERVL